MSPQQSIGHYRVLSKLGEGGMGEVWRASDTKLGRDVAIKVLPPVFAQDPDRLARFTREAQVLASLNHPNIAAIYGVEDRAIVMELVEGETLEAMLEAGLPVEQALGYARQIADGLEAAHEKGIIHRDLKPANIKVTGDGVVKLLDFGLAKAADETAPAVPGRPTLSPTMSVAMTQAGVIMGTAAYMSPEQARGKPVDKRADIWAFGVILYEMLTGSHPYGTGETVTDTLAAIVLKEADFSALPPSTPARIRRLIERCLKKDPKQRLRDIGDARLTMEEAEPAMAAAAGPIEPIGRRKLWLPPAIVAGLTTLAAAVTGGGWWRAAHPEPKPMMHLTVDAGQKPNQGLYGSFWLSPRETHLAFLAAPEGRGGRGLAIRPLDQPNAKLIADHANYAFFSPDGKWIGYIGDGKIHKVPVDGGIPMTICDADPFTLTAAWGEDGMIVFGRSDGLWTVSQDGGSPRQLTETRRDNDKYHLWPHFLPGGKALIFTAAKTASNRENANIDALSLGTGRRKTLLEGGYGGQYLASGHLAFVREKRVFAVRFDPDRLELRGVPVPVIEDLAESYFGSEPFDAAPTGTLIYQSGTALRSAYPILWMDSSGKASVAVERPAIYSSPRLAPDGKHLAAVVQGPQGLDVWVFDLERKTSTQLTFDAKQDGYEILWTPDGKNILFATNEPPGLWYIRVDGSGGRRRLLDKTVRLTSISPDGRQLLCTGTGIFIIPIDFSDPEHAVAGDLVWRLKTSGVHDPEFSPDGRWIAYAETVMGREEVFVMPSRGGEQAKWRISVDGGKLPRWSRTARELFFRDHDGRIMVAEYTANSDSFHAGNPRQWGPMRVRRVGVISNWDLAPDGQRIVGFPSPAGENGGEETLHVTFLLNFFDELRRRVR